MADFPADVAEKANGAAKEQPLINAFKLPWSLWLLREAVALTYWGSIVATWFYDVSGAIAKTGPALLPLYQYKLLILVGLFLLTWAFVSFAKVHKKTSN